MAGSPVLDLDAPDVVPRRGPTFSVAAAGGPRIQPGYDPGGGGGLQAALGWGDGVLTLDTNVATASTHDIDARVDRVRLAVLAGWRPNLRVAPRVSAGPALVGLRVSTGLPAQLDLTPALVADLGVEVSALPWLHVELAALAGVELRATQFDVPSQLGTVWFEPALRARVSL